MDIPSLLTLTITLHLHLRAPLFFLFFPALSDSVRIKILLHFTFAHRKLKSIKPMLGGGRSDGSVSNKLVVGGKGKCLDTRSRTRPYYFRKCKRMRHTTTTTATATPTTTTTSIDSLPAELLFEILLRLPADHLIERARFVCRRWSRIIHSHTFVNAQILHSPYQLLLSGDSRLILIIASLGGGRIETSVLSYECRTQLFASSNGLAVEASRRHALRTVYIANPATKQSLVLPSRVGRSAFDTKCGIAFAASSSKYKFTMPYRESQGLGLWALTILTFGVDNSWRDVAVSHLPSLARSLLMFSPPLITEGFMHWVRLGRTYCLTMDVESEMIRVTESPYPSGCGRFPYFLSTGNFLSVLISYGYNFRWEVFVMDMESGDWRKVLGDIELGVDALERWLGSTRRQVLKPIGWVKYPEVLAFTYSGNSRACVFYNLDTHEITSTELPYKCSFCNAFVHKNSLARLP